MRYLLSRKSVGKVRLRPVSKSDCMFLYELLAKRGPTVNISHKKMPTYEEHVDFVMSKPYSKWYIVLVNDIKAGTVYLTHKNEVGIFIRNEFQGKRIGHKALRLLIQKNPHRIYYANINPQNRKSIRFFKNNGFRPMQYTYELNLVQQKRN